MKIRLSINLDGSFCLYMLAYCIFLVTSILLLSFYAYLVSGSKYLIICSISVCLLVVREIVYEKLTLRRIAGLFLCGVLAVTAFYAGTNSVKYSVGFMFFFIYCFKMEYFDAVAKVTVVITSLLLILIIGSAFAGIILNYHTSGTRERYYLGFTYALYAPVLFGNIVSLEIYQKKENIKIAEIILLALVNYLLYYWTDSRLAYYLTVLTLVMAVVLKFRPSFFCRHRLLALFMCFSFVLGFLISWWTVKRYDPNVEWMAQLNKILANRLKYTCKSLEIYGVGWFGQYIAWVGNGLNAQGLPSTDARLYVDCLYIQILQRYGIIFFTAFVGLLTATMFKLYKNRDFYLLMIMTIIAIHCVIDDLYLYLFINTFWLLIGTQWRRKEVQDTGSGGYRVTEGRKKWLRIRNR